MSVLIIRPQHAADDLAQRLQYLGQKGIPFPVIGFDIASSLSQGDYQALQNADMVIAVSKPASQYADLWLSSINQPWPKTRYLAVGRSSAYCLNQFSQQQVTYPEIEDSEHLLALEPLQQVKDLNIAILRGQAGRELLYQTLTQRGANVYYIETYQRITKSWDSDAQFAQWRTQAVDKIVVTSAEQLNLFTKRANLKQRAWLQSRQLFVTSDRIGKLASELGFKNITITQKADNETLANYLAS